MNMKNVNAPLSDLELKVLRGFLEEAPEAMFFHEAAGFLTGVVSAPTTIMPSTWLPVLLGGYEFDSMDEAQRVYGLLMRLYNQINTGLNEGKSAQPPGSLGYEELGLWCRGYLVVSCMDPVWGNDEHALGLLHPVGVLSGEGEHEGSEGSEEPPTEDADTRIDRYRSALPELVAEIHGYWLKWRRMQMPSSQTPVAQKIGRNESCSCGSGLKFKKCCGR